jgi:hypothetical protein
LIDVSKYVLTAVVITTIYKDWGDERGFIYGYGVIVSILTLVTGLLLCNKKTGRNNDKIEKDEIKETNKKEE